MKIDPRTPPEEAGGLIIMLITMGLFGVALIVFSHWGPGAFIAAAIFVTVAYWKMNLYQQRRQARLSGRARAKFLEREVITRENEYGEKLNTYWVVFQFKTGQGPITLRASVKKPLYQRAELGTTMAVRYNVTTPQIALLEDEFGFDNPQSRIGL